jgi:DNA-binding NarL/FixJ family response regulator
VIIISGHVRQELLDRAIESGAWGYLSKSDGADAIVDAVRQVMDGQFILGSGITDQQIGAN